MAGLDLTVVPGDTYPVLDDSELSSCNLALEKDGLFRIVSSEGLEVANEANLRKGCSLITLVHISCIMSSTSLLI